MARLKINTGLIALDVEDEFGNIRGIFKFNPEDTGVANRLFNLQTELNEREKEWIEKAKQLDEANNAEETIKFLHSVCVYLKEAIDNLYGIGTSKILFGNAETFDMFNQFFDGIIPYYKEASVKRIEKATAQLSK